MLPKILSKHDKALFVARHHSDLTDERTLFLPAAAFNVSIRN